ncbi:MAG: tRNA pseudouridine(55) synthase TruB [Pseudomonadota bacterium]
MNGVLLIDKERGITSHDVVDRLRDVTGTDRIGHAGTLDPDATGLLVMCLGPATKISSLLMDGDKSYEVSFQLGVETDSFDSTGTVVSERPVQITENQLREVLRDFVGVQLQKPPKFSAVKVKGKKLYEYARKGIETEVAPREITIYSIELKQFKAPYGTLTIDCSKGTYVRALVHDLGQCLGSCAITTSIRRTRSGYLDVTEAKTLREIEASQDPAEAVRSSLMPISKALSGLPTLRVCDCVAPRVLQGAGIRPSDMSVCKWITPASGRLESVLMVADTGEALALGSYDGVSSVRVKRVF